MGTSLISNPPYNIKWNPPPFAQMEPRFFGFEVPPQGNANFAFILTALDMIDEKAAFLLPKGVLSTDNKTEAAIRAELIQKNLIDAVILLPDRMFEATSIGTCILLFSKVKKTATIEMVDLRQQYIEETRDQNGQFGSAAHEGRTYHKTVNVLTDETITSTVEAIAERKNVPGLCKAVTIEEIKENSYLLMPSRYIDFQESEASHREYADIVADLNRIYKAQNAVKLTVNESVAKSLGLYDTFMMMKQSQENELGRVAELVGQKLERQNYISLSKNAAEFKIENKAKDRLPEMLLLFLNMWKQHIMYLNNEENILLAEFRDALLPDLMSGKIDVSE